MAIATIISGNHESGNLYVNENKLYIKNIKISKNPFTENPDNKKIFYKSKNNFFIPLDNSFISFLAPNGTGKTLLSKTIHHFFLNCDTIGSQQVHQPEFAENDNFSIINKYIITNVEFKTVNNTNNIYLFSLNNVYSHQYDYLILPHLEYVLNKFNLVRVFNDYNNYSDIDSYIKSFYEAISTVMPGEIILPSGNMAYEQHFRILFKENLIFDQIKEKSTLSLFIYLIEVLAKENNISIKLAIEKIINHRTDKSLSWEPLEKFINLTMFTQNNNRKLVKELMRCFLTFNTKGKVLKDLIIESIYNFKENSGFYKLFNHSYVNFSNFISSNLINNNFLINGNKKIKLLEHYSDLFDTTLFYPLSIIDSDEININSFSDSYDRYDKTSVRSLFSLIEKNGSDYEKINYKNICALIFFKYLKTSINLNNLDNKILIISDDIFSQTDNHNILVNLLEFNEELQKEKLLPITTWINLTHSFSAFQIFNKSLNVEYENMFLMKKDDNKILVEPLQIRNKFFVEYLNAQIKKINMKDEEKIMSIFTKIIYERFLSEQLINQKQHELMLTHFLHYFSSDLHNFIINNNSDIPWYIHVLIDLLKNHNNQPINYDNLFKLMEKIFLKNPSEYKNVTDVEICFFYSIYIRFLIEKNLYKLLINNTNKVSENSNFTGNLISLLKERNIKLYYEIIGLYNLAKNYIHFDYINYEYLIFINPKDYKNKILKLQRVLNTYIV